MMSGFPLVHCLDIKAVPPSLGDNTADLDRLKKTVSAALVEAGANTLPLLIPLDRMPELAASFRTYEYQGIVIVNMLPAFIEIVDFLPRRPQILPAVAIDLGTTHLEATLLNLFNGEQVAWAHTENSQIRYGDDILSRIHFADQSERVESAETTASSGLEMLHNSIIATINDLLSELARQAKISRSSIRALCVSGNTTMVHFLLKLSPHNICREPYIPLVNAPDPCRAAELGIAVHETVPLWILPSIGSYFGGDLISGILTCGLDQAEKTSMLIDVGTNAEVILGNRDWLIACAGAAGPALEGGVASMGMRAGPGAIDRVRLDTVSWQLKYRTIDNLPPAGICGSGLIDLVAELFLGRIIDIRGKFRTAVKNTSSEHAAFLSRHLRMENGETHFIVASAEESAGGRAVTLSQIDLDAMMRSKAAMYAILTTLTAQVNVKFADIETIFIAGAFGKHIDPGQAIILGMLPDLPLTTYKPVGNSSLRGAELILMDDGARSRSMEIPGRITYIELNVNQEFMIRFSGSRFIPHTDPRLFPSVPVFKDC